MLLKLISRRHFVRHANVQHALIPNFQENILASLCVRARLFISVVIAFERKSGDSVMILGMSLPTFTVVHVVISLIGIVSGFFVLFGLFGSNRMPGMTALFLLTTILTSLTGFLFPFEKLLPSHILGILSLIMLAIAVFALYVMKFFRRVALDLYVDRADRAIPQRLRACHSELPENRSAACAGAERSTQRATLCRRPGYRTGVLRGRDYRRGAAVPAGVTSGPPECASAMSRGGSARLMTSAALGKDRPKDAIACADYGHCAPRLSHRRGDLAIVQDARQQRAEH